MPCSCDGYEPPAGEKLKTAEEKIRHLEQRLCQAQSLIHKILKFEINQKVLGTVRQHMTLEGGGGVGPNLLASAKVHVAELVQHKRAEHAADRAKAVEDRERLSQRLQDIERSAHAMLGRHEEERRTLIREREATRVAYDQVRAAANPSPSDEDLLG